MAVTGASGSGKTTLSKLLIGFYKPDRGMIEVCGNNLDDISLAEAFLHLFHRMQYFLI